MPLLARIRATPLAELGISAITAAELYYGAARSARRDSLTATTVLLESLQTFPFDSDAARAYGLLNAELRSQGRGIGELDTLIASHALALGATLITNNVREFKRVPGLLVEDWTH